MYSHILGKMKVLPAFETPQKLEEPELANFLRVYMDTIYYFCICPFRLSLEYREAKPTYISRKWLPQQIICGFLALLEIPYMLAYIRNSLPENSSNPSMYLNLLRSIFGVGSKICFMQFVWLNEGKLLELLNYICEQDCLDAFLLWKNRSWIKLIRNRFIILTFCLISVVVSALVPWALISSENYRDINQINMSIENWWNGMYNTSKSVYLLQLDNYSKEIGIFMGAMAALGSLRRHISECFNSLILLIATLTLWTSVDAFEESLEVTEPGLDWELDDYEQEQEQKMTIKCFTNVHAILNQFEVQKEFANLLNSCFGNILTLFLLEMVVFYPTEFGDLFVLRNWKDIYGTIRALVVYAPNDFSVLLLSANAAFKVDTMKLWLTQEDIRDRVPKEKLHIVLDELNSHIVAMRGSGVFPVTYAVLASMAGTMLTYFVICVQNTVA